MRVVAIVTEARLKCNQCRFSHCLQQSSTACIPCTLCAKKVKKGFWKGGLSSLASLNLDNCLCTQCPHGLVVLAVQPLQACTTVHACILPSEGAAACIVGQLVSKGKLITEQYKLNSIGAASSPAMFRSSLAADPKRLF